MTYRHTYLLQVHSYILLKAYMLHMKIISGTEIQGIHSAVAPKVTGFPFQANHRGKCIACKAALFEP